jgi:response regulator RpfG family c-di-GMP phosphodiesterase
MDNARGLIQAVNNEILIVDDTTANLRLLYDILKSADYEVRPASEGKLALRSTMAKAPGLILLDINMPEMDGFEVCRQLKANEETSSIPIIFISALNDEAAILKGFKLGGVDYITKPFREEEVLARVRTHLNLRNSSIELENRNTELKNARDNLEEEVKKRTSELIVSNLSLKEEIAERKNAEDKIRKQVDHLATLSEIDRTIISSVDLHLTLDMLLKHVLNQLGVDAAGILLLNPNSQFLESAASLGFHTNAFENSRVRLGEDYAGRAALTRQLVQIANINSSSNTKTLTFFKQEGFVSYYGTPLLAKGQLKGVLEVFQRKIFEPDIEWLNFLSALAGQASIAIDNALLFNGLQRSNTELGLAYEATIEGWSRALDLRDKETEGHTQRVAEMTVRMAEMYGLHETEIIHIRHGALLHDIGKMGIPDSILLKPGPLTDEEWSVMIKHPTYAYHLLLPILYLHEALDIPYCHHEKWDGTGYPRALKSELIPLSARLFMVIDVWDALTSDRPYRAAWSEEKALAHIRSSAGIHFDPNIVELFIKMMSQGT